MNGREVGIFHGVLNVGVAQQLLDLVYVHALLKQEGHLARTTSELSGSSLPKRTPSMSRYKSFLSTSLQSCIIFVLFYM